MNRVSAGMVVAFAMWVAASAMAQTQPPVNTTPSRQTLDEASRASCEGVSEVVTRCTTQPDAPATKANPNDPLTKSREKAKAAFDRRDTRGRAAALDGKDAPASSPVGDAQRLGGVTVTGKPAADPLSVEQVLQRALNPNAEGVPSADGKTVSHYGLNGARYDCVAKCVGPACCVEVRALPNPARDSNSIGR